MHKTIPPSRAAQHITVQQTQEVLWKHIFFILPVTFHDKQETIFSKPWFIGRHTCWMSRFYNLTTFFQLWRESKNLSLSTVQSYNNKILYLKHSPITAYIRMLRSWPLLFYQGPIISEANTKFLMVSSFGDCEITTHELMCDISYALVKMASFPL